MLEEDIYTIDDGWKVDFAASEEVSFLHITAPVLLKLPLFFSSVK